MRRRAGWRTAASATTGIALFVVGFVAGWETFEPIAVDERVPIAGSGAFVGVVSTSWEWQTAWLTWASVLALIGIVVALGRLRSARRVVAGSGLVLLGLSMGWGCVAWWLARSGDDFGWAINPLPFGMSIVGAALTLCAGAVLLSGRRHRRSR